MKTFDVGVWLNISVRAASEDEAKDLFLQRLEDGSITPSKSELTIEETHEQGRETTKAIEYTGP